MAIGPCVCAGGKGSSPMEMGEIKIEMDRRGERRREGEALMN